MPLAARELNRATLARQLLVRREPSDGPAGTADVVRRLVALQAQHPASPYVALWNRVAGFDPADLDAAYADRSLVRGTSLRITLHAVHAADHPGFRTAMQPTLRGARLADRRFTDTGLTAADADALQPGLLAQLDRPRTADELVAWIDAIHPGGGKRAWWALRHYGPFVHAPTGGPWSFPARVAWLPAPGLDAPGLSDMGLDGEPDAALTPLVRRYLESFGPASVLDVAHFLTVQRARARTAVEALADELEVLEGPDGATLYDVPGAPRPAADTPVPPRLLGMWDNVLLAHLDRSRIVPPEHRKVVTRLNGDVLPTLLVDGYVAGVWRTVDGPAGLPLVEARAFTPLPEDAWAALSDEAASLLALFAGRDPHPYRRYDHWWAKLPDGAQVRLLPDHVGRRPPGTEMGGDRAPRGGPWTHDHPSGHADVAHRRAADARLARGS
ncbi:winged helix DNA-binding domain-containing protein [Isoptericola hypogeus]|uniref:Winged helix DNA-binding domain-containing protein n=1 Tax=Isoptericola hypogeus TaxID=300179 RepID=A0ABP4VL87_9MICO